MRVAVDSNILVYAAGGIRVAGDRPKVETAQRLLVDLAGRAALVAPVQVFGEAIRVLGRQPDLDLTVILGKWEALFDSVPTTAAILHAALALAAQHKLQHWDSVIVAGAVDGGCSLLVSEDMHDGFVWRGLTIVNPFAAEPHPLLASLLDS